MNIESRVAKLEAQNRLLKGIAFAALALAALPWAMGSEVAVQENVQAKRFTLVGDDEAPRGIWAFDPATNTTTFSIEPDKSSPSVVLAASPDQSTVRLLSGIRQVKRARNPRRAKQVDAGLRDGEIAMDSGKDGNAIRLNDGSITIERGGKTVFSAPPKTAVFPVAE